LGYPAAGDQAGYAPGQIYRPSYELNFIYHPPKGRGLLEGFAAMDRCDVVKCGKDASNGITYGTNKKKVCPDCWEKYCDGKIDLKQPDAFIGGSAIFTRTDSAMPRDGVVELAAVGCLF